MRVLVIHNRAAGDSDQGVDQLRDALDRAGHDAELLPLDDADAAADAARPWADAGDGVDLIAVSGGDGTVGRVFIGLAGVGYATPVTILATGTANNIARTLGIPTDEPLSWVAGWDDAERVRFHLPHASAPGFDRLCVEGVGAGMLAELLRVADRRAARGGDDVDPVEVAREVFARAEQQEMAVALDGRDVSGRYLGVHAMNVREAGPNLAIAPDADAHDGLLDLVLLGDEDREALLAHAERGDDAPPPTTVHRGRRVSLRVPTGVPVIVDDQVVALPADAELEVVSGGASLLTLVPAASQLAPLRPRLWR